MTSSHKDSVERIYKTIQPIIIEKDSIRERLLKLSRESTRKSGAAVNACIRNAHEKSRVLVAEGRDALEEIHGILKAHPEFHGWGVVDIAEQEYAEASIILAIQTGDEFPDPKSLAISPLTYATGLADAANELRRVILHELMKDQLERAKSRLLLMEEIYEYLLAIGDYSKGILPQLRKKTDLLRMLLERTEGDVLRAIETKRLGDHLRSLDRDKMTR